MTAVSVVWLLHNSTYSPRSSAIDDGRYGWLLLSTSFQWHLEAASSRRFPSVAQLWAPRSPPQHFDRMPNGLRLWMAKFRAIWGEGRIENQLRASITPQHCSRCTFTGFSSVCLWWEFESCNFLNESTSDELFRFSKSSTFASSWNKSKKRLMVARLVGEYDVNKFSDNSHFASFSGFGSRGSSWGSIAAR